MAILSPKPSSEVLPPLPPPMLPLLLDEQSPGPYGLTGTQSKLPDVDPELPPAKATQNTSHPLENEEPTASELTTPLELFVVHVDVDVLLHVHPHAHGWDDWYVEFEVSVYENELEPLSAQYYFPGC